MCIIGPSQGETKLHLYLLNLLVFGVLAPEFNTPETSFILKAKVREKSGGVESGWEVLAFTRGCDWSNFSWDLATTIAMDTTTPCAVSDVNVCLAHSHGARVVMLSDEEVDFTNSTERSGRFHIVTFSP